MDTAASYLQSVASAARAWSVISCPIGEARRQVVGVLARAELDEAVVGEAVRDERVVAHDRLDPGTIVAERENRSRRRVGPCGLTGRTSRPRSECSATRRASSSRRRSSPGRSCTAARSRTSRVTSRTCSGTAELADDSAEVDLEVVLDERVAFQAEVIGSRRTAPRGRSASSKPKNAASCVPSHATRIVTRLPASSIETTRRPSTGNAARSVGAPRTRSSAKLAGASRGATITPPTTGGPARNAPTWQRTAAASRRHGSASAGGTWSDGELELPANSGTILQGETGAMEFLHSQDERRPARSTSSARFLAPHPAAQRFQTSIAVTGR